MLLVSGLIPAHRWRFFAALTIVISAAFSQPAAAQCYLGPFGYECYGSFYYRPHYGYSGYYRYRTGWRYHRPYYWSRYPYWRRHYYWRRYPYSHRRDY